MSKKTPFKLKDIPVKTYAYDYQGITHVRDYIDIEDIPQPERAEFFKWMRGQTIPVVVGVNTAVYVHDFYRWYEMKFNNKPTYWD